VLSATWFVAYSAVLPLTQATWGLSGKEAGLIQAAFHLGYVCSLFIAGFLADHFGARRTFLISSIFGWASPFFFIVFADGFWSAFWLHALTGLCQGGSYTPVIALINDHVPAQRRGRAMGFFIAGSSAGYALCLISAGLALKFTDWRGALAVVALFPWLAWMVAKATLHGTENRIHPRPAGEPVLAALPAVWKNKRGMMSIWGYTCHNWELLALWAWLPAFLTAALVAQGSGTAEAAALALSLSAITYVANIAGSIIGGTMADRWGRTQTILLWSIVSLVLSFSIGWLIGLPIGLLIAVACLHNFSAIADSSTHTLVLAESVPPHYLGVAYAMRSVVGFGVGVVSPVVFGWALDLSGNTWGWAWMTVGMGALLGPLATWRLRSLMKT
jgi:MFS family permease